MERILSTKENSRKIGQGDVTVREWNSTWADDRKPLSHVVIAYSTQHVPNDELTVELKSTQTHRHRNWLKWNESSGIYRRIISGIDCASMHRKFKEEWQLDHRCSSTTVERIKDKFPKILCTVGGRIWFWSWGWIEHFGSTSCPLLTTIKLWICSFFALAKLRKKQGGLYTELWLGTKFDQRSREFLKYGENNSIHYIAWYFRVHCIQLAEMTAEWEVPDSKCRPDHQPESKNSWWSHSDCAWHLSQLRWLCHYPGMVPEAHWHIEGVTEYQPLFLFSRWVLCACHVACSLYLQEK